MSHNGIVRERVGEDSLTNVTSTTPSTTPTAWSLLVYLEASAL
jgi:hypothetical protein